MYIALLKSRRKLFYFILPAIGFIIAVIIIFSYAYYVSSKAKYESMAGAVAALYSLIIFIFVLPITELVIIYNYYIGKKKYILTPLILAAITLLLYSLFYLMPNYYYS